MASFVNRASATEVRKIGGLDTHPTSHRDALEVEVFSQHEWKGQHDKRSVLRRSDDLRALNELLRGRSYAEALPAALPDNWLHRLDRDLRQIEAIQLGLEGERPYPARPILLVSHLLIERSRRKVVRWDIEALGKLLEAFQCIVEREIVSRLIGISTEADAASLPHSSTRQSPRRSPANPARARPPPITPYTVMPASNATLDIPHGHRRLVS